MDRTGLLLEADFSTTATTLVSPKTGCYRERTVVKKRLFMAIPLYETTG